MLLPERTLGRLLAYTLVAQAYALLLPGQLAGEAVKAYRLGRSAGTGGSRAASAVVFDKLTAIGGVLLLTLAGLALAPQSFGAAMAWGAALGLAGLGGVGALLAVERVGRVPAALLARAGQGGPLAALGGAAARFLETWQSMARRPRTVALSLAWGVGAQLLSAVGTQMLGLGLGIDLPVAAWCVVIGGLSVVLLAPVTVGGLGLREASLVGLLGLLGVPAEPALALALAILAFQVAVSFAGLLIDLFLLRNHDSSS